MSERVLGIVGGSGVYEIEGLADARWRRVETPWGAASDRLLEGRLGEVRVVFLPRHGRGHAIPPDAVNYRANIDALKRLGVTDLISVTAVGSLKEELAPGAFVLCDQYIDRTTGRERSFFGPGCVAHVSLAAPACARLAREIEAAGRRAGIAMTAGGTYLCIEGPQFSTLAESRLYRSWGADVIGMTAMPEARLAREAELCYATCAMVTDYDCWHEDHGAVTVERVMAVLEANAGRARSLVGALAAAATPQRPLCEQGCERALDGAVVTAPARRDEALLARLDAVAGRVLTS